MANDVIKKQVVVSSNIGSVMNDAVGSVQGLSAGFQTAIAGMNLLTKDTKALQETLGQVTNLMAFTQGIQGMANAGKSLMNIGKVGVQAFNGIKVAIGSTGIGLLIIALGTVIAYFDDIKKWLNDTIPGFKQLSTVFENLDVVVSNVFDAIIDKFKIVGNMIKNFFKGNFKEVIQGGKDLIDNSKFVQKTLADIEEKARIARVKETIKTNEDLLKIERARGNDTVALERQILLDRLSVLKEGSEEYKQAMLDLQVFDAGEEKKANDEAKKLQEERTKKYKEELEKRQQYLKETNDMNLAIEKEYQRKMQDLDDETALQRIQRQRQRAIEGLEELKSRDKALYDARLAELNTYYDRVEEIEKDRLDAQKKAEEEKLLTDIENLQNKYIQQNKLIKSYSDAQALIEKDARDQAIKQVYDDTVKEVTARQDAEYQALLDRGATPEQLLALKAEQNTELVRLQDDYNNQIAESDKALAEQKKAILDSQLSATADVMSQAASLLGEETAAGKAAAIASTTINTYSSATKAYDSMSGIPVVGPALGAVAAGLAVAAGIKNVKEIVKVKTPGGGGGGAPAGGGNTYRGATPQVQFQRSGTSQIQDAINQRNQEPVRAYVVSTEITSVQAEDRRREENNTLGD